MSATREDAIEALRGARREFDAIVERVPESAWKNRAYDDAWTARDLLAHIGSMSAPASFILGMARASSGSTAGASFDLDSFNAQQVAMRAGLSVDDVSNEVRANLQRDIQAVERADQALLDKQFAPVWGEEAPVSQVIVNSLKMHLGVHIADLRRALGV